MIPLITGYLTWQRSDKLREIHFAGSWMGAGLVVLGLFAFFLGELGTIHTSVQYRFVIFLCGAVWAFVGTQVFRILAILLLLPLFMVPFPNFIYSTLSQKLQLLSSEIGVAVIRLFGISVYLEGNVIDLGTYRLQVVEACDGLRYLFPLMTLGVIVVYFHNAAMWKRVVIFASTIPITILMNRFRINLSMKILGKLRLLALIALLIGCGGAEDRKSVYMDKGQAFFDDGNYEKARLEFKNVLQIDPKDLEGRYKLAQTMERLQDWRAAAGHYLTIIAEDPSHRDALIQLGKMYLLGNNVEKARENAEVVLEKTPADLDALTILGKVQSKEEDNSAALATAERALESAPHNPGAASLKAAILIARGDVEGSIGVLRDAIAASSDNIFLRLNLARVYGSVSRIDDAIDIFGGIVERAPDVLAYRIGFAQFLTGLKRLDEAEEALKKTVALFPEEEAANLAYVEFLASRRGVELAIDALKTLIATEPQTIKYQFTLGKVYEAAQRLDNATNMYEEIAVAEEEGPNFLAGAIRRR